MELAGGVGGELTMVRSLERIIATGRAIGTGSGKSRMSVSPLTESPDEFKKI